MRSLESNNTILVNFQASSKGITYNRNQERPFSFLQGHNGDMEYFLSSKRAKKNDKRLHFHLHMAFLTYYERLNSFRSQEHPLNFLEGYNKDYQGIRVNQRFINSEQSQTLQELLCLILIFIVSLKEAKRMFLTIDRVLTFKSCQKCYIWVKMKHHVKI